MQGETSATEPLYRRPTQIRGIATFEQILDAGHAMVDERGVTGFSLYDIAERAGVASGSVYHFFPSLTALFSALVERYDRRFSELVSQPIGKDQVESWEDIVRIQTERSRRFINNDRPSMLLILGPGQTWQSRLIDTVGDTHIAHAMVETIRSSYEVPNHPDPDELMHNAIRCLESLWQLSFQRYGTVTDAMAEETNRVMLAYLALYWPKYLEPTTKD